MRKILALALVLLLALFAYLAFLRGPMQEQNNLESSLGQTRAELDSAGTRKSFAERIGLPNPEQYKEVIERRARRFGVKIESFSDKEFVSLDVSDGDIFAFAGSLQTRVRKNKKEGAGFQVISLDSKGEGYSLVLLPLEEINEKAATSIDEGQN